MLNRIEASSNDRLFGSESLSKSTLVRENEVMIVDEKGECNIRAYFSRVPSHLVNPEILKGTKESLYYRYFWVEIRVSEDNINRRTTKWEEDKVISRVRGLLTYHGQGDFIEMYDVPTCFPITTKLLRYYKR